MDQRDRGARASRQRIVDEREATRAGLMRSAHLGAMKGEELRTFDELIDTRCAR